jgi:hypothetical protein
MKNEENFLLKKQIKNLSLFIFILNFFIIGVCMNFLVVTGNGGKMPVLFHEFEFEHDRHFSFTDCDDVSYCYLSDIFQISDIMFSIGDLFIIFSLILLIYAVGRILIVRKKLMKFR